MTKSILARLVVVVVLSTFYCDCLYGRATRSQEAEKAVMGWLKADPKPLATSLGGQVKKIETFTDDSGEPLYYIVYLDPSGFVIVSADDRVEPIIGFVEGDSFDPSRENPLGALVTNDLNGRILMVRSNIRLQALDQAEEIYLADTQKKWQRFINLVETPEGSLRLMGLPSVCDVRVAPLVKTKWGQGSVYSQSRDPKYCFNYYTPNHYPCGCGITAMAQLMRFHEHPKARIGVHEFMIKVDDVNQTLYTRGGDGIGGPYKWEDMVLDPNCYTGEPQRSAIGALCYDLGIASRIKYGSSRSGVSIGNITSALRNTFMYENAVIGSNFNSDIEIEDLDEMINPNLDAGHPVILGLAPDHVVVCDGYGYNASTAYHHLNMGWYGNWDVWYNLPNIDSNPSYNIIIHCVYNIFPSGSGEIISGRVIDVYGNPINQATVTAKCGDNRYEATTDSNGIYALAKIPSASTYTISVTKPGFIFDQNIVATGTSSDLNNICGNKCRVDFIAASCPRDVCRIEISKSIEYYRDERSRHNIDAALMADGKVAAVNVVDPTGTIHPLNYEGEVEFCTELLLDTPAQLATFPSGDWAFIIWYADGGSHITSVRYPDIPLVTQEPKLTFPWPNETDVPLLVTFTWQPVTDQNVTKIELSWEPVNGVGLGCEVAIPPTETHYGPVLLSPSTHYQLWLTFGKVYRGENSDGIHYVIDADSEQKYWFQTRAATIVGDFDEDSDVDAVDFADFARAWLTRPGDGAWNPYCDISSPPNNLIDIHDLAVFVDNWLKRVE